MAAITICSDFGVPQNKVSHCFYCFPIYLPSSDGTRCHDFVFWTLSFKPTFSLSSFTFIKRLFSSLDLVKSTVTYFTVKLSERNENFSFNIFNHMDATLASLSILVCSDCSESAPQLLWNLPSILSLEVPSPSFLEFSIPGIAHFLLPWFIPSFGRAHLWDLEFLENF